MNEKLIGAIASALNLEASEFGAALKDGDKWLDDDTIATKIGETVSAQVTAAKKAQHSRGLRESTENLVRWMKSQGFQNEGKLQGTELLDAFSDHLKGQSAGDGGKDPAGLSKEELAKLPSVKLLINEARQQAGSQYEALKAEYETFQKKARAERVADKVAAIIPELLQSANVVLDVPNGAKREERIKAITRLIDAGELGLNDKGEIVFVDETGAARVDDYGKPLDFKKRVVEIGTSLFGIQKQDPAKGGANPQPGSNGGSGEYKPVYRFGSAEEYSKAWGAEPDATKRAQMTSDFNHQQKQAAGT